MVQKPLEHWWFSCKTFNVHVTTRGGKITGAAPVIKRFRGQGLDALERWVISRGWGPAEIKQLKVDDA